MRTVFWATGLVGMSLASTAFATILPPNNLHLQDNVNLTANIDEALFNKIVNDIIAIYKPIVTQHGATLSSNNLWRDNTVNASAQQSGNRWVINMYGGLARRPEVTPDGFAMVVCHELGHHLGGFPMYKSANWAATEGQSDYFATQSCAKEIWRTETEANALARQNVEPFAKTRCDEAYTDADSQNLCYRTAMAGKSLATLLSALGRGAEPQFHTPDSTVVNDTYEAHPEGQCRLDTYFQGGLCARPFNRNLIPGKNHPRGQGSLEAETVAAENSCHPANGDIIGMRPRCWFAPKLQFMGLKLGTIEAQVMGGNGNGSIDPGETVGMKVSLSNGARVATRGVKVAIRSRTNGVTVVNGSSTMADLEPGATQTTDDVLSFQVGSQVECGSKAVIEARATSDAGAIGFSKEFPIGRLVEQFLGKNETPAAIPDRGQLVSPLVSSVDSAVQDVIVHVNVSHSYMRDLRIYLVAPNGSEKFIVRPNNTGTVLDADFKVSMPGINSAGTWNLRITDEEAQDSGTLNWWSLKTMAPQCDAAKRHVVRR